MPKTVAEQITDRLRSEILTGEIRPGARLLQDVEAARLDVSRTPLREAFRQLEAERLVQIVPNRGAIVTELRSDEVREVFLIRGQLEPMAAAAAARLATDQDIAAIAAVLEKLERARNESGTHPLVELNKEFHFKVYDAAAMPRLVAIIASLWGPIEAMRAAYAAEPLTAQHAADEHARLYEAVRDHDADAAAAIARQHVEAMAASLLAWMDGSAPPTHDRAGARAAHPTHRFDVPDPGAREESPPRFRDPADPGPGGDTPGFTRPDHDRGRTDPDPGHGADRRPSTDAPTGADVQHHVRRERRHDIASAGYSRLMGPDRVEGTG